MLPPPDDPDFDPPAPTEAEFMSPSGEEDAALLETGAWGGTPPEPDPDLPHNTGE